MSPSGTKEPGGCKEEEPEEEEPTELVAGKGSCMNADTTLLCAPNKSIHRAMWIQVFDFETPAMGPMLRPRVIAIITHTLPVLTGEEPPRGTPPRGPVTLTLIAWGPEEGKRKEKHSLSR